jgi:hypothetical protein
MGKLGFIKDAYLRTRDAATPHIEKAAALYLHPRSRKAVIRDLNLEFCSACNLRCTFCSLDSTLRAGVMAPELLQAVLDEIADRERYAVRVLNLHHSGDVLLHPKFPEMLDRVARARAASETFPRVNLLTSATHLRGDKAEALLESGAVDWLRFSVDGGNREDFERIRVRAQWDEVLGNINAFLDEAERRGKRLRTGLITVFDRPDPDLHPDFVALTRRVTNYMPRPPHNWVGKTDVGVGRKPAQPQGLCAFVLFQAVVLVDGRVTLCCNDLNAEGVIGDLRETSLHEIFRGPARAAAIRAMREDRRRDLPFCGTCDLA